MTPGQDPPLRARSAAAGSRGVAPDPEHAIAGDVAAAIAELAAALDRPHQEWSTVDREAWRLRREAIVTLCRSTLALILASSCSCCGRRWSTRTVAARLPGTERGSYWRRTKPLAHTTIGRIVAGSDRYGQRVHEYEIERVAKALVGLSW